MSKACIASTGTPSYPRKRRINIIFGQNLLKKNIIYILGHTAKKKKNLKKKIDKN